MLEQIMTLEYINEIMTTDYYSNLWLIYVRTNDDILEQINEIMTTDY